MKAQLPNSNVPIADPQTGMVDGAWQAFFQALTDTPAPSKVVAATGSPFSYQASVAGALAIQGTVTALSLVRGRQPVALDPGLRFVPMGKGDVLMLTYSAAPGLVFLPS